MTRRHLLRASALTSVVAALPIQTSLGAEKPPTASDGPFKLPPLPYEADALEPHIDAQTMTIHHGKHHATYVAKLNEAVGKTSLQVPATLAGLRELLSDLEQVPEDQRAAVRNHGGGHFNHTLFWNSLSKDGGKLKGSLLKGIETSFKSEDAFLTELQEKGTKLFGSGWVWLCYNPQDKALTITTTPNQDTPLAQKHEPLLGIDVWEHAYYLKYQNKRPDYLKAVLKVIAWDEVAGRYESAVKA